VVLGALAFALPHRIPAASQGTMNNLTLGGTDTRQGPRQGQAFAYYETAGGGMGARNGLPGLSGVHTHMSNTRNTPVEALEQTLPVRVVQYALRQGSGGRGQYRGGDGLIRELELLSPASATLLTERRNSSPYGAAGGGSGAAGRNTLVHHDGKEEYLPSKVRLELAAGDRLRLETPGGGGYGPASPEAPPSA
jgi:N-methylhydantoinase B/oxoprolinase/acetone carboxylase alpha subunit